MPTVSFNGDKIKFPYSMSVEEIEDVLGGLQAATTAVAEFVAVLGSSGAAEVVGGLSGLANAAGLGSQWPDTDDGWALIAKNLKDAEEGGTLS